MPGSTIPRASIVAFIAAAALPLSSSESVKTCDIRSCHSIYMYWSPNVSSIVHVRVRKLLMSSAHCIMRAQASGLSNKLMEPDNRINQS